MYIGGGEGAGGPLNYADSVNASLFDSSAAHGSVFNKPGGGSKSPSNKRKIA